MPIAAVPGQTWTWQGHHIYYVQAGATTGDRPPLLLVHGFGASTDHWWKNIADLQADFQVWAIDLLGFGRSAKPAIDYSGQLWQQQLTDFIQDVIGQPAIVAGNSLGGYAALCAAAAASDWVKGVVLLNSAGPFTPDAPPPEPSPLQKLWRSLLRGLTRQPWAVWLVFKNLQRPQTIRRTLEKVYCDRTAVTDDLVEAIRHPSLDPGAFEVFRSVFRTPQGEPVDQLLAQLSCPLLLLWGTGDPWMNCQQRSQQFQRYARNLTEHFLEAGHCPHDEVPDQVDRLIRDWVNQAIAPTAVCH
ncbi:alpha/beta fold hydrolase [Synechococcus elongatus IITB7]|uniref:alpha/beta fold hydrolase n=1 Tax=Synechococcus elongatus TaxID=32046 RepID=UPI0030D29104